LTYVINVACGIFCKFLKNIVVQSNLKDEVYADANEFAADVRQVWANCVKYNGPDHQITQLAKQLSDIFERKLGELRTLSFDEIGT
jgi:hypothetical protein